MLDSLYIAASGMNAQQAQINSISNNVANVNTTAFKKGRTTFEDLFYRRLNSTTGPLGVNTAGPSIGLGTAVARMDQVFSAGDLVKTGNALDLAIQGQGFFEVTLANGEQGYARPGSLSLNAQGQITTQTGEKLTTKFLIPADATQITVSESGVVTVQVPDQTNPVNLGQIELANFVNPEGLQSIGAGLYQATESSGEPYRAIPGEQGVGTIEQGYTESSNVDLVQELINLIVAQQAYQMNSRVVQISDGLLSTISNLSNHQ